MTKPLPEDEWKLKVSAQYQEAMKTPISLATASLILPVVFLSWAGKRSEGGILLGLTIWAYVSWICLILSITFGMVFYWASSKYVKVICGGTEQWPERRFEQIRDISICFTLLLFIAGLVSSILFLRTLL
jgi:choline-glycine betaine transporter